MSNPTSETSHQKTLAFIAHELVTTCPINTGTEPVRLRLSSGQLALFLSHQTKPTLALSTFAPKKFHRLYVTLIGWQKAFGNTQVWHTIEPLSEQEQEGIIITPAAIAMHHLLASTPTHSFLVSPPALEQNIPDPDQYHEGSLHITVGEKREMQVIITALSSAGYVRQQQSIDLGTFKVSGEHIDIAHPAMTGIYRLTFNGSTIERVIHTEGRRTQDVPSITLPPVRFPATSSTWSTLFPSYQLIASHTHDIHDSTAIIYDALASPHEFPFTETPELTAQTKGLPTLIVYENFDHVKELAAAQGINQVVFYPSPLGREKVLLRHPSLVIISEETLAPQDGQRSPITHERALELISELRAGHPAVHTDHGIGIFEGIETRQVGDSAQEYLIMRYAEGDVLSVPVQYAHKITPYLGEKTPAIHRLHGTGWAKTKQKAKHDAVAFAKELLSTARARSKGERSPYVIQPHVEQELHQTFPHTLTVDQARTWDEVKEDLTSTTPADRIIVGDVGFGKTELAIRAAYHAAKNGRQVAVLAPTTLLVQQHFDTFTSRLPAMKKHIGMLSRFTTTAASKQTRAGLADGSCLICIGTQALLSSQTKWNNLSLVIIDEEQRFGVKQKEHFKTIRATSDVISLSATPIPRTLSMALSGLRQLSVIATAPRERKDIITTVSRLNESLLTKAIQQELDRDGQIYIVAPKIRHLAAIKEQVATLFPDATLAIAHGQMPDETLGSIIQKFDQGKTDILVSSSIVENGLDLPNANTMIVWHAPQFGLSDLYQLRGRIGRREKQGYAYFLYDQSELTLIQKERLTALTEASRLGSGWLIAQRDLEIRGAGNLLGAEQSGAINAVGVQLYLDLVQQAVEGDEVSDVTIELPLPALLPQHYIADTATRTRWYIRLNRSQENSLPKHIATLEKSFGTLPPEAHNLIRSIRLQKIGSKLAIKKISSKAITPPDEYPYERLEIVCDKLPIILESISTLGNWKVRNNQATLDVDKITPELIDKLITVLKK